MHDYGLLPFMVTGKFEYKGTIANQNPDIMSKLWIFMQSLDKDPSFIIETGTAQGGFTWILSDICDALNLKTKIISIDPREHAQVSTMVKFCNHRVTYWKKDAWSKEVLDDIESLIKDDFAMFFLDGGDKVKDFEIYKHLLKPRDRILVHDFAIDALAFEKLLFEKNIWQWHDICEGDIDLNYVQRDPCFDSMASAVWGAYVALESIPDRSKNQEKS